MGSRNPEQSESDFRAPLLDRVLKADGTFECASEVILSTNGQKGATLTIGKFSASYSSRHGPIRDSVARMAGPNMPPEDDIQILPSPPAVIAEQQEFIERIERKYWSLVEAGKIDLKEHFGRFVAISGAEYVIDDDASRARERLEAELPRKTVVVRPINFDHL